MVPIRFAEATADFGARLRTPTTAFGLTHQAAFQTDQRATLQRFETVAPIHEEDAVSGCRQRHPDRRRHTVEFLSSGPEPVVRRELVTEAIASKSREHMQVNMKHLLTCCLAIGQ